MKIINLFYSQLFRYFLSSLLVLVCLSGCASLTFTKPTPDYIEPTTGMEFVFVEGGQFMMGDSFGDGNKSELPVHQVTLDGFAVGMHEVTFDQYDKFCDATGIEKPSDEEWGRGNRPVINVSWHDANAFAEWLSKQNKQKFNLPSEAQWEYFARAGTTGRYWMGNKIGKNAAQCDNCINKFEPKQTVPVGSFRPNPWGIYDTAGNVNEWCQDNRHKNYQGAPDDSSPWLNGSNRRARYRGGSWSTDANWLRSASRDYEGKNQKYNDIGFRLIMKRPIPSVQ